MFHSLRLAAASAAAAALALAYPAHASPPAKSGADQGAYHVFYTPAYAAKIGRVPNLGATGEMEYFGGTVFSKVKVVSVMWGPNVNSETVSGMPDFFKALVNSTYVDQLGEYSTKGKKTVNGHKGSKQTITRGTFVSQVIITPKNQNTTISNKAIQKELMYQIGQGNLPTQDRNTIYMIFFPANVTINAFGLQSCSSFGAYHFATSRRQNPSNIFYGVMPDCGYTFDDHTVVSSHEFSEALSDNIPTPGTNPKFPQAWNNSQGYEIGDLCEGTQGTLTTKNATYYVQQEYLNSIAGCSTGNYTSP